MLNQYLTDAYLYLHDYSLANRSFSNAKLILLDLLNQISIYQYLTVTYQYFMLTYLKQHLTSPDQYLNNSYRLIIPK